MDSTFSQSGRQFSPHGYWPLLIFPTRSRDKGHKRIMKSCVMQFLFQRLCRFCQISEWELNTGFRTSQKAHDIQKLFNNMPVFMRSAYGLIDQPAAFPGIPVSNPTGTARKHGNQRAFSYHLQVNDQVKMPGLQIPSDLFQIGQLLNSFPVYQIYFVHPWFSRKYAGKGRMNCPGDVGVRFMFSEHIQRGHRVNDIPQ